MAKQSTAEYYKKHPDKAANRRKQQRRYNKKGSSKPGTKNITGDDIRRAADQANARLKKEGKGGTVGDNKDYSHRHGKLMDQSAHRRSDRLAAKGGRAASARNKNRKKLSAKEKK